MNKTIDRLLLIWLPNWLGDCVMLYPALAMLTDLGFSLRLIGKPWLPAVYGRDDWFYVGKPSGYRQQIKLLTTYPEKDLLVVTNSFSSALVGALAGKKTVGYSTDGRKFLLKRSIRKPKNLHEVIYFWNLAVAGAQFFNPGVGWVDDQPEDYKLAVSVEAQATVNNLCQQNNIPGAYCVICPAAIGCGEENDSKIWPHWTELAVYLRNNKVTCLVCPGPQDKLPDLPGVICLPHIDLAVYKALLARAVCVVANDTGPMHLAAALGVPTLGLFGRSDPLRTRPWQGHYVGSLGTWPTLNEVLEFIANYFEMQGSNS